MAMDQQPECRGGAETQLGRAAPHTYHTTELTSPCTTMTAKGDFQPDIPSLLASSYHSLLFNGWTIGEGQRSACMGKGL